jgi:ankyrin repeat protein
LVFWLNLELDGSLKMGNTLLCVNDKGRMAKCIRWNEYINRSVPSGETLLTIAATEGNAELATRLINAGADVNHTNQNGTAPLHIAIRQHSHAVVDVLLAAGADVDIRDRSGLTPLHLACVAHNSDVAERLLRRGANPEGVMDGRYYVSTPLMAAAENGDRRLASLLLRHGSRVDARDWWRSTALLKAVQAGSTELVGLLLHHGADPDVMNRFGGGALHYATIADHCEIVRMLVDAGCRVNAHIKDGMSDQHRGAVISTVRHSPLAAAIHRECFSCFVFLLEHGADVDSEDMRKKTPLVYALTDRAWDCGGRHYRAVPQCLHSDNPPAVDSTRMRFADALVERGARLRPVWEYVVWQMRSLFVEPTDTSAILLCIRAMGFVHREGFKTETFYRTLALSAQWDALWMLYLSGFSITEECLAIAVNKLRQLCQLVGRDSASSVPARVASPPPRVWLSAVRENPRTLRNLCVVRIRERIGDNVIFGARQLGLPNQLYQMITLEVAPC